MVSGGDIAGNQSPFSLSDTLLVYWQGLKQTCFPQVFMTNRSLSDVMTFAANRRVISSIKISFVAEIAGELSNILHSAADYLFISGGF